MQSHIALWHKFSWGTTHWNVVGVVRGGGVEGVVVNSEVDEGRSGTGNAPCCATVVWWCSVMEW